MLENKNTCMYRYAIEYNWNIYKSFVSNYHVDNKDYFWIITWITCVVWEVNTCWDDKLEMQVLLCDLVQ